MAAAGFVAALGSGALATQAALALLGHVPVGRWELREIGSDRPPITLCVRDPAQLLQLQHPRVRCSRYVLDQNAKSATVQYTCPGAGQGRTTLTIEDENVLRIATQGLAAAAPFDVDYTARRVGPCA